MNNDINDTTLSGTVVEAEMLEFDTSTLLKVRLAVTSPSRDGDRVNQPLINIWNQPHLASQLKAGTRVFVKAMLQTRDWEYQGEPRTSTEIVARQVEILGTVQEAKATSKARKATKVA